MVSTKQAEHEYAGKLTYYEPFNYIYSHSSFILDPRQVFKLWRASMMKVNGVYLGSDKLGHFIAKGHINYARYREKRDQGALRDEAVQYAVALGTSGDFFYSEKRMVGYLSSGILSNGDLAADFLGLKFYINLTEPVMLKGKLQRPLLELRDDGYWHLADHVQPDSDFFTNFISDHLNEVLNPNIMEPMMRNPVRKQIVKVRHSLLAHYSDRFGNHRSRQWFADRVRELSTYYGQEYDNEKKFDEMVTVANTCFPDYDFKGVTDRSPMGRTLLHQLAAEGELAQAKKAVADGADVNATVRSDEPYSAEWGNRPLHYAARSNDADMVAWLLDSGAEVNATNDRGVTPLHRAVQVGGKSVTLLIDAGADVNAADEAGRTPLHWAATYPRVEVVQHLIEASANVSARDHEQRTPLHFAAEWGQPQVIDLLLDAGADVNARAAYGVTPLQIAAAKGHLEAVAKLIAQGADVTAADDTGRTALHAAAAHSHSRVAQALIAAGADPNVNDAFGGTPLHEAAVHNNTHLAKVLIEAGADPNATNQFGNTPLHLAAAASNDEVLDFLAEHGGDVHRKDENGKTPIELATTCRAKPRGLLCEQGRMALSRSTRIAISPMQQLKRKMERAMDGVKQAQHAVMGALLMTSLLFVGCAERSPSKRGNMTLSSMCKMRGAAIPRSSRPKVIGPRIAPLITSAKRPASSASNVPMPTASWSAIDRSTTTSGSSSSSVSCRIRAAWWM